MITSSRRGFITGLVSLIAAPAIVRVANIMPVKAIATSYTAKLVGAGGSLSEAETAALYSRMKAYTELIEGLKTDGIWDKLDSLYVWGPNGGRHINLVAQS